MPKIGVIADDLTGATTTGVLLARSGAKTLVYFNEEALKNDKKAEDLDAVVVSSNSRSLPGKSAYEKVAAITAMLRSMNVEYFSKRIDTTLRGGVGVEIDAMLDVLDPDTVAVVVPSMPQSKRIVVGGYSIIDGVPLVHTPAAHDVRTPVSENHVPKLLNGQSRRRIGSISLEHILQGTMSVQRELKRVRMEGAEIIVADAVTMSDVETIAEACVNLKWKVLAVGPGPFTMKLAYARGLVHEERPDLPETTLDGSGKTVLIAAGSATPVTKRQMEVLCEDKRHERLSVEPRPLIDGGMAAEAEIKRAVAQAENLLANGAPRAILLETALHGELLDLDSEDREHGYARGTSAEAINTGLGAIVAEILKGAGKERIAGIYTTGGDTMVHVCARLGVQCLEAVDYVIAQADIMRMNGTYQGMPIVGKGGLTGNDRTALDIVERLFKEAARMSE